MSFSTNGMPLDGPNGSFPRQRIGNAGTVFLRPVRDMEGRYLRNEIAQLPTQEKEYSSVANAAKNHLLFGEVKRQSHMKKMGGGFQREMDRKKLMARPMPGHTGVMSIGPRKMRGANMLSGVGESMIFGPRSLGRRIGMGNQGRSAKGWLFRLFGTDNRKIPNFGMGSDRDQNF